MGEHSYTLAEVLIALAILTIALLGIAGGVALQNGGIVVGLDTGHATVTRGYFVSTATMLAQERLEEIKRLPYTAAVDGFGADPVPAGFPDENPVSGSPNFSRQVRVQTGVPAADMKSVTVTVSFNLPTQTGVRQESISLATLIAERP